MNIKRIIARYVFGNRENTETMTTTTKKTTKFTIEKVKWSWASAVKNKSVYRDDEFVRTKTKKGALNAINFLMGQARGLTNTITVFRDGEYFTYFRHSMPCLGGLVKYRDSHGKKYFMNPYFPRDIRVAFPEGDIIYIGCYRNNVMGSMQTPYFKFIFSEESPWVSAFGSVDTVIFKNNYFVLTNMDTDPTVFYSMMRLGGLAYGASMTRSWHPKAEILMMKTRQADPRRLAGQKPLRISGGTWAEGYGYTRPYNESIFKTTLPHKFKDFGGVGSYPRAPYDNRYYISEMKKVFKVDAGSLTCNEQNEKILLEAWDHFKEQAKELSDTP